MRFIHSLVLPALLISMTGCLTVPNDLPRDDRGQLPTELQRHVFEAIQPANEFAKPWFDSMGYITEKTEIVTSDVQTGRITRNAGWTATPYDVWFFCATLLNPPRSKDGAITSIVLTIYVRELRGFAAIKNCRWYDPTEKYKAEVDARKSRPYALTK